MPHRTTASPHPPVPFALSRWHFATLAVLYGLAVLYSSLLLGPDGLHYLPLSTAEAWQRFLAIHFVDNASDQRPDWIANAMMIIPLTYFLNGAFAKGDRAAAGASPAAMAFLVGVVFILATKYAQLFMPPRTVTLNYIVAQTLGAAFGVALFRFAHRQVFPKARALHREGRGLIVALGAYTLALMAFLLMPFDIALSPGDLATRFANLPLSIAPDEGHRTIYRAVLVLGDAVAMAPFGMLLAVIERDRSFRALLIQGIGLISFVTILSLFVLSASPFFLSLVTRPIGVAVGIQCIMWLKGKDLWKRHYRFAWYVPMVFPTYVALLLWCNGLLSGTWLSVDQAVDALEPRRLLPLWSLYIVSKVQAAQTVATAFAAFAPIGAMIWLRRGFWSKGMGFSAFVAFTLSLSIEFARTFKPGLYPEIVEPFVAAVAAALTFRAMPTLWRLFEHEARESVLRDTFVVKVAEAAQMFGGIALLPAKGQRPSDLTAGYARRLAAARRQIADLELTVLEQERELERLRQAERRSGSSAA